MDVHRASIVIVVLNGAGKVVMQSVIETGAERVRGYLKQLRGKVARQDLRAPEAAEYVLSRRMELSQIAAQLGVAAP
jgi:hypothetical protein